MILSTFLGRVEPKPYYCAYFEAFLCRRMEQTGEVHFNIRYCYTEVTRLLRLL